MEQLLRCTCSCAVVRATDEELESDWRCHAQETDLSDVPHTKGEARTDKLRALYQEGGRAQEKMARGGSLRRLSDQDKGNTQMPQLFVQTRIIQDGPMTIDENHGRLSPPHLQMLWNSAEFVGPGDVRDLVAEVRRIRLERDELLERLRIAEMVRNEARAASNRDLELKRRAEANLRIATDIEFSRAVIANTRASFARVLAALPTNPVLPDVISGPWTNSIIAIVEGMRGLHLNLPGISDEELDHAIELTDMHAGEYGELEQALVILRLVKRERAYLK